SFVPFDDPAGHRSGQARKSGDSGLIPCPHDTGRKEVFAPPQARPYVRLAMRREERAVADYTGAVRPGGPIDVRELPGLTISKCSVGPMDNNAYLLVADGEGLLIDAAAEPDRLIELIGTVPVRTIVTTHRHGDHWQALADLSDHTSAQIVAHP